MKLFSEKVKPTFTSSNHNILTVENYEEVFFDVYEFEINGEKFIAEKESTFKDSPVVSIPVEVGNKKYNAKFILNKGPQEVLFNEKNIDSIIEDTSEEVIFSNILEDISEPEDETIVFEKKENILQEINEAKSSAIDHVKQVKEQESLRAKKEFKDREDRLAQAIEESRKVVLDEFLSLTESTKEELFDHNDKNATDLRSKLFEYVNETFDKHSSKLSTSIERDHTNSVKSLKNDIKTLAEEIYNSKASTIEVNLQDGFNTRVDEFNKVLDSKIDDLSNNILALEKANVDINDTLNKNTNKALSRVGSVKKDLEVSIKHLEEDVQAKFDTAEEKAKDYYDSKILTIEEALEEKDKDTREYILNIINENKNDLLDKFSNLKNNTTTTIVEQYGEKNVKIDPKKIQNEIQTNLTNTFSQQLLSLRKAVDMYSGGGSVAKQFANGGTMEGNLTVTGEITADKIFATTLLSASEVNYEFELSGFSVTGDISANGNLTVNQDSTFAAVTASSIFNTGDITVTGDVEADEFVGALRGAVSFKAKAGEALTKGDVVYISGISGNTTVVSKADANDPNKMPAFGLAETSASINSTITIYTFGTLSNLNTDGWPTGAELFVGTTAGQMVTAAPTGESAQIQKVGKVTRGLSTSAGSIKVQGPGRTNATPNLNEGRLFVGNSSNQAVADGTIHVDIANSRVGIGESSPGRTLHVNSAGANVAANFESTDAGAYLSFSDNSTTNDTYVRLGAVGDDFQFFAGGAERIRIDSAGDVGIGTTSPSHKLNVAVSDSDDGIVLQKAGTSNDLFKVTMDGTTDQGEMFLYDNASVPAGTAALAIRANTNPSYINTAANFGIGTTTPGQKLTVAGSVSASDYLYVGNNNSLKAVGDGYLELGNTNSGVIQVGGDSSSSTIAPRFNNLIVKTSRDDDDIIFQAGASETELLRLDAGDSAIKIPDVISLKFGSGGDLAISHDGNNSIIAENGAGDLYLQSNNASIYLRDTNSGRVMLAAKGGSGEKVELYYEGSKKFETSSGGATITGNLVMGGGQIKFADDGKVRLGDGNDLNLYHNGTDSVIENVTGDLKIQNYADDKDIIFQCDDGAGGTETYFRLDGSASSGDPVTEFPDNSKLSLGTSQHGITLYHDGTDSFITNAIGDLTITNFNNDKDIIFKSDDGSGGTTTYFKLDGSHGGNPITNFPDSSFATFGSSNDLQIYHNGFNSNIDNYTGGLYITQRTDDGDLFLRCDDGSGGITSYIVLDGSDVITRVYKNFTFSDDVAARFGTSNDLVISHDGTDSKIRNTGGDLIIQQEVDDKDIIFKSDDGSGGVTAYLTLDGSAEYTLASKDIRFGDSVNAQFGNSGDLAIFHDGSNSLIYNANGALNITQSADDSDIIFECDNGSGGLATYILLDGSDVITRVYKNFRAQDNVKIQIGSGADAYLKHDGTDTSFQNDNGNLYISNTADDKDIIFQCDDGAGGGAEYFRLDGGETKTIFSKPIQVGVNDTGYDVTFFGATNGVYMLWDESSDALRLADSTYLQCGNGADLQLWHDGSNSTILNYTGNLTIKNAATDSDIIFECDDGSGGVEAYFRLDGSFNTAGNPFTIFPDNSRIAAGNAADLSIFHNGTNSNIENITGNLIFTNYADDKDIIFKCDDGSGALLTYFYLDGSLADGTNTYTVFPDNRRIRFGSDLDLDIHHDGSNSYISQTGTGSLNIQQTVDDGDLIFKCDNGSGGTTQYFRLDGGEVVNIFSKNVKLNDSIQLNLGGGNDLQLYHDGSNSYITNATGDMYFINSANDKDILFMSDDGSGGFATYLSLDGSEEIVKTSKDLVQTPGSSVTPANNGELVVEATNNTTLTFKLKGSDGTVRSGTLTLS